MELEHTFSVPVPVDEAFRIMRDIERIGPCMPGASVESVDGEEFSGRVKVKVGPIQVTYEGTAAFTDVDEEAHTATIEAKAKETRGPGTARATIVASCLEEEGGTRVHVLTDLAVTGKPAQFGRGVLSDVGDKLLGRFADCLAEELGAAGAEEAPAAREAAAVAGSAAPAPPAAQPATDAAAAEPSRRTSDVIDLFDVAGGSVLRRGAPVGAALALLALLVWLIRRR